MTKEITAFGLFVLFGLAIGGTALAIGEVPPATIPDNITSAQNFIDLIDNIVDWIFVVVLVFAVIFIVLAGLPGAQQAFVGCRRYRGGGIGKGACNRSKKSYWVVDL
ncbi:MAG: hypothetical protein UY38_C0002G0012 [Parcubacteria group bacterium GW2011_GWB1_49_12]|nr:MAG: hypothetical protein UY38_C0002G0012 [Parcubacteria group bacterium GW2011_GWB1_49_12]